MTRLVIALMLVSILAATAGAVPAPIESKYINTSNLSAYKIVYNFPVKITISPKHPATYITAFNRPANFTLNITNVPKVVAGVTPKLVKTTPYKQDEPLNTGEVKLDPRSCQNDLAYCYQIIEREPVNSTNNARGANYSALSSYSLPERRVKLYVCIGDDTECVESATGCFCPKETIAPPPNMLGTSGKCTAQQHLCQNTFGSFVMCAGNLSSCQQKYLSCGCGTAGACSSTRNTCINSRNELGICKGALSDCLGNRKTCYCGPDMMFFQKGCTTLTHRCTKHGVESICQGSFTSCALNFDTCDC